MYKLTRDERFKDARQVYNQHGKQTMEEVARTTGLQKSLIQALEDGESKRSVGYDKVARLAFHYGVSADYLLCLSDDPFPQSSAVNDLGLSVEAIEWIKSLDNEDNRIDVFDWLLTNRFFQILIYRICEYTKVCEANKLYQELYAHLQSACKTYSKQPDDVENTIQRIIGEGLLSQNDIQEIIPQAVRDYLVAISKLHVVSQETAIGGLIGLDFTDAMEYQMSLLFDTLIAKCRKHTREQATQNMLNSLIQNINVSDLFT